MVPFSVGGQTRLGRAERLDPLAGAASAEFGVGGDRQVAGLGGGMFPFQAVGHGLGEDLFVLLVMVAHGTVAGGQVLMPGGAGVVAGLARSLGFGGGANNTQICVEGAQPG